MSVEGAHDFARAVRTDAVRCFELAAEILASDQEFAMRPVAFELVEVAERLGRAARTVKGQVA